MSAAILKKDACVKETAGEAVSAWGAWPSAGVGAGSLDRIDIQLEIPRLSAETLRAIPSGNPDTELRTSIARARSIQEKRFVDRRPRIWANSEMSSSQTDTCALLDAKAEALLKHKLEKSFVSPRAYYRTLKVARTIADLAESEPIREEHLAEAFQYRLKISE